LEKPWLFEIDQTPDGILYNQYCYECTTALGQVATQKVTVLQAADCKATLSLTDNAKLKTTNPVKNKDEVLDGNDGTNSKDPAKPADDSTKKTDDTKTDDTKTDDTKTDDTKTDDTKTDDTTKPTGGRRLEDDSKDKTKLLTSSDAPTDDATKTNPDDYYLPKSFY
jgi:hypothetical protein